jgi:hypothetical protein
LSSSSAKLGGHNNNNNDTDDDIKFKIYYSGLITVIYVRNNNGSNNNETTTTTTTTTTMVGLESLREKIREICHFDGRQQFTVKWVDEEGDPCTISSQMELDEAVRLYYVNKETELVVHVFGNTPAKAGMQCVGEDRSIYRRGARRWRKLYLVNGHRYQAKRFARTALCKVCEDRIWGLGRQGYKCLGCKVMVHKRCHKFILSSCSAAVAPPQNHHHSHRSSAPIGQVNPVFNDNSFKGRI